MKLALADLAKDLNNLLFHSFEVLVGEVSNLTASFVAEDQQPAVAEQAVVVMVLLSGRDFSLMSLIRRDFHMNSQRFL